MRALSEICPDFRAEGARTRIVDLGSGGGVPGLVLAEELPSSRWVLIDSNQRRTAFLRSAVAALDLGERVTVWEGRAEDAGRDPSLRAGHDLVVARGFGPPAVTAECAAPLLRVGGCLVVSEPPGSDGSRWPADGVSALGLQLLGVAVRGEGGYAVLQLRTLCGERFSRRSGVPAKRPLF